MKPKVLNPNLFTPWAMQMYEEFSTRVCNTFIITGNIGDYAIGLVKLTEYLKTIFSHENGFAFDEVYTYDLNARCLCDYSNVDKNRTQATQGNPRPKWDFNEACDLMSQTPKVENEADTKEHNYRALIIRYPESLLDRFGYEAIKLHKTITASSFFRSRSIIVIIAENVHAIDQNFLTPNLKATRITLPLPNYKARLALIEGCTNKAVDRTRGFSSELTSEQLAMATAGLTALQTEDLILGCDRTHPITAKTAIEKKQGIISAEYSNIIELMDPAGLTLDDFAGQDDVKKYFKDVVIDALREKKTSIVPKGVLLMGPPGTGKSFFAKCLAGSAGVNCVDFKMSKILDKYVGVAEQRLDQAFRVFHAMAPVIVFIDELDQAVGRQTRSDGPKVYANLFGSFLAELSKPENRGQIIWLAATNYPNNIDEALKRAGRFDKKIPFFAPDADERKAVLRKHIVRNGGNPAVINFDAFASKTEGYTQAEIESVVVKALELAARRGNNVITNEFINMALECMIQAQNKRITEMENIALLECNDLEFVPAKYKERRAKLVEEQNQ